MSEERPSEEESRAVLVESCKWGSPAALLLSDDSTRLEGRFHAILEDIGVIQIALTSFGRLNGLPDIRLGQYCGVTFVHRDRPFFFLGTLTDHFAEGKRSIVEFPLMVAVRAEMRRTFRVPVLDDCVRAEMVIEDDRVFVPRVKNISLTGTLLEASVDEPPLYPYDKVGLRLSCAGVVVALRGAVRRCDVHRGVRRYGVLFPETAGAADPPPELVTITRHVERLWLGEDDDLLAGEPD